jgi:ribonuclease Y
LSKVIPRVATTNTSEFTITTVDIPSEDIKGKVIWREGRNVVFFERITWVELIIDDTPLIIRLSSYDHEKRWIATEVLRRMIKDGRINPVYIEKTYNELVANFENVLLLEKGKEALNILGMPPQHADITKLIGQFNLRYSYGQNLWIHSVEVAKMSEMIANEMGLDGGLAKKAGLLHDIGKVIAQEGESHTVEGGVVLRKYGYDDVTINTAEGHHHDIPMISPIGWIVAAADAISASRPWARFNSKNFFVQKMAEMEKLINEFQWVDKVHIMQAGREIMIFVNPNACDDLATEKLLKEIWVAVEAKQDFPGMIRVVGIREKKIVSYLR